MTREEIVAMAREADLLLRTARSDCGAADRLVRFASMVAAAERKECAAACSVDALAYPPGMGSDGVFWERGVDDCAAAIRARVAP